MRYKRLDLNLLVALDALLSERSITRAAERLHVTQSAMSNSLARLRDYFKDELLVQIGRRMEATPRAQRLQREVRELLARIDNVVEVDEAFDPTAVDHLMTIQASDYFLQTVAPVALELAEAERSRVRFEFVTLNEPLRLDRGEVDLVILPRIFCPLENPTESLLHELMTCVVWRDSPLAADELTFDGYLEAAHVVVRPTSSLPPVFDQWFGETFGRPRRIEVTSYSLASLPALVVGTHRIATIHRRLARRMAVNLPVVLKPVPVAMPQIELVMQWHASRTEHGSLKWLRGLLKRAVASLDASLAGEP